MVLKSGSNEVKGISKQKLSLVIPCYNEQEGIPWLAEKLNLALPSLREKYVLEIIFVDDGSTDKTNELLHQHFSHPDVKIVKHDHNKNLGAALRTGFVHATGDLVAALDSDCTYQPQLIATMATMINEDTDIVTVSPYHPLGKVHNVPAYRLFLSKSVSRLYRMLLKSDLHTFTAMVRVYKKEVVKNVSFDSNTFLGVTEVLAKALLQGYKAKELPAELQVRRFGASKMKTLKVMRDHLGLLGKITKHKLVGAKI